MKKYVGFTLIELMVTLAVAIILLAVGIPMFSQMQANSRTTAQTNGLVSAITLARAEAVGKRVPAAICAKGNSVPTNFTCGGAGDWANGWEVFLDEGGVEGAYDAGTDTIIRVFDPLPAQSQVDAGVGALRFLVDGAIDTSLIAGPQTVCVAQPNDGSYHNLVQINLAGQIRTERQAGAMCP